MTLQIKSRKETHAAGRAYAGCIVLFLLASTLWCCASDLLVIRPPSTASSSDRHAFEVAAQFYGLDLKLGNPKDHSTLQLARQNTTLAVAIDAGTLTAINRADLLRALQRKQGSVPLLIFGLTPETDAGLLKTWSDGSITGIQSLSGDSGLQYIFGNTDGITQRLTGRTIPFPGEEAEYLVPGGQSDVQQIVSVRNENQIVPVLAEISWRRQNIFFAAQSKVAITGPVDNPVTAFAEVAPAMIFVKYATGERGWHSLAHYANFTIDDPWLREPYGHISYNGLLAEMEKHNFHTTIAFIPWNYDRSDPTVAALFRDHPQQFSISIHGDNHDHKEFEDLASKPLTVQTAAIRQSLARMEKFKSLSGIPYDNVFIFPHSIGSESVLEKLRLYNFIATVNSTNVPMDRTRPSEFLLALRPVTMSFADFPSITRYPASLPNPDSLIAVNAFLDNPLFFYAHQDFFSTGIAAFNRIADDVNSIEPDTRWRGLGDIMKHLYLVRLTGDNTYDVLAFSNDLSLENTTSHSMVFDVKKQEFASQAMTTLTVDGQPYQFQLGGGTLHLKLTVPAHSLRNVVIQYKNDLDLASVPVAKDSVRVYLLRIISDFRDNTLSQSKLGRDFTAYYYKNSNRAFLIVVSAGTLVFLIIAVTIRQLVIRKKKGRQASDRATLTKAHSSGDANHDCVHVDCR
ncbi:MAG TPA: hypothetical protein VF753_19845 [Terriglobales bacterium]